MNRGLFQNFLVQQMMMGGRESAVGGGSGASCWSNMNTLRSPVAPPEQDFPLFPPPNSSSSSSPSSSPSPSSVYGHHHHPHHYPQGMLPPAGATPPNLHDAAGHHLPAESWSQLLLGGHSLGEAEDKYGLTTTGRKMKNSWEDHLALIPPSASAAADHIQQEFSNCHTARFNNNNLHVAEEINKAQWNQILPASSPSSSRSNCISTSTFTPKNMLDFTNMKNNNNNSQYDPRTVLHDQSPDNNNNSNSECNSSTTATGVPIKKARVQGSSSAHSTFKVRKEKLGDRITALHQIVSPFGKTDTASVLLEAIGYIRFLQSQIEALSSPYLSNGSGNINSQQLQQPALTLTSSKETGNSRKRGPPELQELGKNNNNDRNSYNDDDDEEGASKKKKQKDLRNRGLCLVPVSFFLHVGGEHVNGADYWASALHGAF